MAATLGVRTVGFDCHTFFSPIVDSLIRIYTRTYMSYSVCLLFEEVDGASFMDRQDRFLITRDLSKVSAASGG